MHEVDRTRRVAALLKREIASLISRELNDNRINSVTVTAVTVSRDLKQATIFVSTIDTKIKAAEVEKLLNKSSKFLRHLLSQNIDLRITPGLLFKYDHSIQRGADMSQLIDKLNRKNGQ